MKLEFKAPGEAGWAEIHASRIDFDAVPPVAVLRAAWPIGEANVDRTAVTSSLVFSPWISGRCDHLRPFSALTEQRLVEWFQAQHIWVAPTPIRSGGLAIPRGTRRLWLSGDPSSEDLRLSLVPSDRGSCENGETVTVATNAAHLIANAPTRPAAREIRLGVAVLLAEALSVHEIIDPVFASEEPVAFRLAARLLECVALGLRGA